MTKLQDSSHYNCKIYYDDGDVVKIFSTALNVNALDYFEGWHCEAGLSRIYIAADATVYSGECENDCLGSLKDNSFQIFDRPTTCKQVRCNTSPDELMITKYKPSS